MDRKLTFRKLMQTVREALRGDHADYTTGPLTDAIILLAVPMVVEMLMESLFAIVDIFWVSRLGKNAVAAVGLTESLIAVLETLAMGLSIGVTALVSRRIGEKDPEAAARSAVQGLWLAALMSLVLGFLGAQNAGRLLALMGADADVVQSGGGFTRTMMAGSGSLILLFITNAAFRGAGDAVIAMRTLIFANTLNMLLGPCLIFGLGPFPAMGVRGAAVATVTGRSLGVLYQLYRLTRPGGHLSVRLRHLRLDLGVMRRLLQLSAAGMLQHFVSTASWIGMARLMAGFGAVAVAGYTIGIRVIVFGLLPSWGIANAAATLVGQSLGAKDPERARQSVWRAGFINLCVMGLLGLLFVIFAGPIVRLFSDETAVQAVGESCLRIIASGYLFYAYGMVFSQAFNGAGDAWTPTLLNLLCFWCGQMPLAWYLSSRTSLGLVGIPVAAALSFSSHAVVGGLMFRRGYWASRQV